MKFGKIMDTTSPTILRFAVRGSRAPGWSGTGPKIKRAVWPSQVPPCQTRVMTAAERFPAPRELLPATFSPVFPREPQVPVLLPHVPPFTEQVPLPGSHEMGAASPVPALAGRFRPSFHRFRSWFHRFRQRWNRLRPASQASSCHGGGGRASPQVALLLRNRGGQRGLVAQQQGYFGLRT